MFSQSDVIFAYTIDDAIEDGIVVDVSDLPEAKEAGFRFGVILTNTVYNNCVKWTEEDTQKTGQPQDEKGRLWDVLYMASVAVRRFNATKQTGNVVSFQVVRVPRQRSDRSRIARLQIVIESRSNGDPVMVIRFPNED